MALAIATPSKTETLLQQLADGVEQLTSSDDWLAYLDTQRKFHRYSFGNCLLIGMQCPDATHVAGFRKWLELGRHVRKGEKGIAILAPIVHRFKRENEETGETETIVGSPRGFRCVYVFDISQTDGDDLPELPISKLQGNDPGELYTALREVAASIGFTVQEDYLDGPNGYCRHSDKVIAVEVRNEPLQQVKTLAHELAHAILHEDRDAFDREQAELEAESVAYIVCADLGIDSSAYSFGYLASWGSNKADVARALQASGQRIQRAVSLILGGND
jgi:antirestriction protein ArdC